MSALPHAKSFRDLFAYQKAQQLREKFFASRLNFQKEEAYSLTDQIRRSSRAIGAQIAEAWAKRRYEKHFISKLTDADGEQQETQHWIDTAADCGYWPPEIANSLRKNCEEIGRLLAEMMTKADLFCGDVTPSVREPSAEYFTADTILITDD